MQDTRTPAINAAIALVINILLNIILSRYLGTGGTSPCNEYFSHNLHDFIIYQPENEDRDIWHAVASATTCHCQQKTD